MSNGAAESARSNGCGDPSDEMFTHAAAAFALLASSARLHIMWALAEKDSDVSDLGARVGRSLPTVSQHLAQLRSAGLVRARREGRRHVYSVSDREVLAVVQLMIEQVSKEAIPGSALPQG
ncbi:HTH-type transcriptional regulator KmtR [Streptomyces sp. ADI95-16]|uniref:ArsR/SmtB family transcription factor n=1 Tax=Streptomyces sp. ADI95-16 TaxID=1522758 RepID=UPI000F3AA8A3|nr:metalloregulator ArsR/SmtB family transcription factor [Streptomyces sp. ADI95-16]AYV25736.1 HTH-type transcriptional regulator KmtR [Streptomyces sp. ADI95-16]